MYAQVNVRSLWRKKNKTGAPQLFIWPPNKPKFTRYNKRGKLRGHITHAYIPALM